MSRVENTISRREFLKLMGTSYGSLCAISSLNFDPDSQEYANLVSLPPEETAGAIDMNLSTEDIAFHERLWAEVEAKTEFASFQDYLVKFSCLLNVSRARSLGGEAFGDFVKSFIESDSKINGKSLYIISEIKDQVDILTSVRDQVLQGTLPSSNYGHWIHTISQSLAFSWMYDVWLDGDVSNQDCLGTNEMSYQQFITPEVAVSALELEDPDKTDYYRSVFTEKNKLDDRIYNLKFKKPKDGLIQKELRTFDDITFGDTLFKDSSEGYRLGHPQFVLRANRDAYGKMIAESGVEIFDGNVGGKMIAGIYQLDSLKNFHDIFGTKKIKHGILRTTFSDDDLFLKKLNLSTLLPLDSLPHELHEGRQEIFPDFKNIPQLVDLWKKFSNPKERSKSINQIINLIGLHSRDENGNIVLGPRWTSNFGNNYWLCNIYSVFLMQALGITDIGHWFKDGKQSFNEGEEYDVQDMFNFFNTEGRKNNWINATHMSLKTRMEMLAQGYVFYGVTRGHTWTILPMRNAQGELIPALSQDGHDVPLRYPNFSYKFPRPRSCESFYPNDDPPQYTMSFEDGILWAHLLPNVEEPKQPFRSPLFGHNIPDTLDVKKNSEETGWVSSLADLKGFVGDSNSSGLQRLFEEYLEGKVEKLPSGNHIFQYGFDLVQLIQRYTLPIGIPPEKDAEYFVEYLKQGLSDLGYGHIINTAYAKGVFNNVLAGFVSHEESLRTGRPFQPIQCYTLVQLFEMAKGHVDWAPCQAGGLTKGTAQDLAEYLLSLPTADGISFVNREAEAVHFSDNLPSDIESFKAGDTFFVAYSKGSYGHTGTILTNPFTDSQGNRVIVVADSNRAYSAENGEIKFIEDGMPRIRVMTYYNFLLNFLVNKELGRNGNLVLLRPTKKR